MAEHPEPRLDQARRLERIVSPFVCFWIRPFGHRWLRREGLWWVMECACCGTERAVI